MVSRLKIGAMIVGLAFGLSTFTGFAMAFDLGEVLEKVQSDFAAINAKGEQDRARIRGDAQTGDFAMAAQPEAKQSKPTQLIVPKDKRVAAAMEEAMPTIKKVLGIHQCIKEFESLRQLNFHAVPGADMTRMEDNRWSFPNKVGQYGMKYHDQNKCVSITTIDQWSMPALNALLFRAIYFADDSGETVNFLYLFKKVDDGSWKIAQFEKGR